MHDKKENIESRNVTLQRILGKHLCVSELSKWQCSHFRQKLCASSSCKVHIRETSIKTSKHGQNPPEVTSEDNMCAGGR